MIIKFVYYYVIYNLEYYIVQQIMASIMNIEDRIKLIIENTRMGREKFALKVGIPYTRIANIFSGRAKVRHEEIEAIGNAYPQYMMWLAYEKVIPEAEQISPSPVDEIERGMFAGPEESRIRDLKDFRRSGPLHPEEEWELEELEINGLTRLEFDEKRKAKKKREQNMPPV